MRRGPSGSRLACRFLSFLLSRGGSYVVSIRRQVADAHPEVNTKNTQLKYTHKEERGAALIAQALEAEPLMHRCIKPLPRGSGPRYCDACQRSHMAEG